MSDKAEKKPDAAAPSAGGEGEKAAKKAGFFSKLPVLIGGVMVIEAIALFGGFKMFGGGPKHAQGADLSQPDAKSDARPDAKFEGKSDGDHGGVGKPSGGESHGEAFKEGSGGGSGGGASVDDQDSAEVKVVEIKAINRQTGRTILYDVQFCLVTRSKYKSKIENAIKDREALIQDRIRTIIAECDPEKLGGGSEPGLETLRRQVKYQLDQIVGEGMIDEVLVPRCIPYRADF